MENGGFVHSAKRIGTEKVEMPSSAPTKRSVQNMRRNVERCARRNRIVCTVIKCTSETPTERGVKPYGERADALKSGAEGATTR